MGRNDDETVPPRSACRGSKCACAGGACMSVDGALSTPLFAASGSVVMSGMDHRPRILDRSALERHWQALREQSQGFRPASSVIVDSGSDVPPMRASEAALEARRQYWWLSDKPCTGTCKGTARVAISVVVVADNEAEAKEIAKDKAGEQGKDTARDRATEDSCEEGMSGDCECYGDLSVTEVKATATWDGNKLDSPFYGHWVPSFKVVGVYDVTFEGNCQR